MAESETRYPEWRTYPSAVSEAVFFTASDDSEVGPQGNAKFSVGPLDALSEGQQAIRAKGDFVPDFDYAAFSTIVFEELQQLLTQHLDANAFDDGTLLLRFVAFDRHEDWSIETAHDDVYALIATTELKHLDVLNAPETDRIERSEESVDPEDDRDAVIEQFEDLDDETREKVARELSDLDF